MKALLRNANGRFMSAKEFAEKLQQSVMLDQSWTGSGCVVETTLRQHRRRNSLYEMQRALIESGAGNLL